MNWGGMPIGFRFYVNDFSLQTKQNCWAPVLKALEYANWETMTLHETESQELFNPTQKVYIAVVGTKSIKVSRQNSIHWREDTSLMENLSLYRPWIQENYMELYAPTHRLAIVTMEGEIIPDGEEGAFLKGKLSRRQPPKVTGRQLVWGEREEELRERMRSFRREFSSQSFRRAVLTRGTEVTVAATAFREGQLHSILLPDGKGGEGSFLYAILPGKELLVDARLCPGRELPFSPEYGIGKFLALASSWGMKECLLLTEENGQSIEAPMPVTLNPSYEKLYNLSQALRSCTGIYKEEQTDIFTNLNRK